MGGLFSTDCKEKNELQKKLVLCNKEKDELRYELGFEKYAIKEIIDYVQDDIDKESLKNYYNILKFRYDNPMGGARRRTRKRLT